MVRGRPLAVDAASGNNPHTKTPGTRVPGVSILDVHSARAAHRSIGGAPGLAASNFRRRLGPAAVPAVQAPALVVPESFGFLRPVSPTRVGRCVLWISLRPSSSDSRRLLCPSVLPRASPSDLHRLLRPSAASQRCLPTRVFRPLPSGFHRLALTFGLRLASRPPSPPRANPSDLHRLLHPVRLRRFSSDLLLAHQLETH